MDDHLQWLLTGLGLCLLAGWLAYRAMKNAEARRRSRRAMAEAAARAEAQRLATEERARRHDRQRAAAQVARGEAARRAAEEAARVEALRVASQEAARAEALKSTAAEAARARAALADAEQAARAEAVRLAATLPAKTAEQTLVMVADDSKVVRVKTGRLLAQHHYRVSFAIDGLDAANQMQASVPDIVITDVEMPGMDGFELTRFVRQNPLTAHIPVIMITAADDKLREEASAAGVSVLLGKPYPEDELIAHIQLAMKHTRTEPGRLAESVAGGTRSALDALA
jgi:CheY-like chemotaxis protein